MTLICKTVLTPFEQEQIAALVRECRQFEGLSLSFPFEEAEYFCLLTEEEILVSCGALCFLPEENGWECSAFTRPACRRRGYFSAVFQALSERAGDRGLFFLTDKKSLGSLKALAALGAVPGEEELQMELSPLPQKASQTALPPGSQAASLLIKWTPLPDQTYLIRFLTASKKPAGSCRLAFFGDSACFYAFEIRKQLRGKGLGTAAFLAVLHLLSAKDSPLLPCHRLFLHVSGGNQAAISLYKKAGLRVTETLSWYLC